MPWNSCWEDDEQYDFTDDDDSTCFQKAKTVSVYKKVPIAYRTSSRASKTYREIIILN